MVRSLTSLGDQLFVLFDNKKKVCQYDVVTFGCHGKINGFESKSSLWEMTSCTRYNYLYVSDSENIYRIHPSSGDYLKWPIEHEPSGLSVGATNNLIVTCWKVGIIYEYSSEGIRMKSVQLSSDVTSAWYAVQLDSDRFVVSHGDRTGNQSLQRVCLIDGEGRVLANHGNERGKAKGQLNQPRKIVLHEDGSFLVNDRENDRLVVISRSFELLYYLSIPKLYHPSSLYLDESRDRLFISQVNLSDVFVIEQYSSTHTRLKQSILGGR